MDAEGEKLFCQRIDNDALRLLEVVSAAGDGAEVVIEATYGWYWAVDLLGDAGFSVHLAHPSGNDWGKRRVKNDERDARASEQHRCVHDCRSALAVEPPRGPMCTRAWRGSCPYASLTSSRLLPSGSNRSIE